MKAFDWQFPYPSQRMPVLARNVVATSQPLAAQAGLGMMLKGGNAVDAALAAAITLTVVEPTSNGIGSDAFCILWDGKKLHGLNASGRSPAAWNLDRFKGKSVMPTRGWDAITVPGAVSAWVALSERFGKLPFADLFEPAIRYAADGYMVSPTISRLWANQVPLLRDVPGFAEHFMPRGRAPEAGEKFIAPAHAKTLRRIAETRGEAFYKGDLAQNMAAHARRHGGAMTVEDLAAHTADWVEPLAHDYRGYTLHEIPPNTQGIAAQIALGILEGFDLSAIPVDSADSLHLQIEAMKLAFADAYEYVSDAATMRVKNVGPARQGIPEEPRAPDRHEEGEDAAARRARPGRHRLSHGRRFIRHDGFLHPVELPGIRLGHRGGRHQHAEPRLRLRPAAGTTPTSSPRASARSTPSSPPSSPRTEDP